MQSDHIADHITVEHHPTEKPLFILVLIFSILIWIGAFASVLGIGYALIIALVFFISKIIFMAHIKGSAIKLGPDQFPDLYNRVTELSRRAGVYDIPDAYIMQAGGTLNAMAIKFLRSKTIILYTDLLEACGPNKSARDMIIGHEIGHIKAKHLDLMWLIIPGMFIPFLGSAYSRAREFTCDRYGVALCNDKKGAMAGLTILAGGGKIGPHVNLHAYVNQRIDMNTGLLTIGKWLGTYPPLSERIAAIEPMYKSNLPIDNSGKMRAIAIISLVIILPILISIISSAVIATKFKHKLESSIQQRQDATSSLADTQQKYEQVQKDFEKLTQLVRFIFRSTGRLPVEQDFTLSTHWLQYRPGIPEPKDPYNGNAYGYQRMGENRFLIWSVGPDGTNNTYDDIILDENP